MRTKKPDELGIYGMSGKVYEWCQNRYDSDYYEGSPETNLYNHEKSLCSESLEMFAFPQALALCTLRIATTIFPIQLNAKLSLEFAVR
jgi:hypothetical protein